MFWVQVSLQHFLYVHSEMARINLEIYYWLRIVSFSITPDLNSHSIVMAVFTHQNNVECGIMLKTNKMRVLY